jgi:hypothetical protein
MEEKVQKSVIYMFNSIILIDGLRMVAFKFMTAGDNNEKD